MSWLLICSCTVDGMAAGTGDESLLSCVKRATRSSRRRSPAWASGHICSARRLTSDTHIRDIMGVLKYEDLHDLILVGHSYAGMIITAVAEQAPSGWRTWSISMPSFPKTASR